MSNNVRVSETSFGSRPQLRLVDGDVDRHRELDSVAVCLAAIARGDCSAFGQLYQDVAPMVNSIAYRVTRNRAIAEEVTQEVLVELWRTADRFDVGRGSARGWIAAIAQRRAIDRVRSEASLSRRQQAVIPALQVVADTTGERLEAAEERHEVLAALDDLSEAQRQAITLAFYDEYTYREVAARLGVPEGTIKTRIRDGLGRLRHNLAS